jgi:predicted component of type VI protein secretion system
MKAQHQQVEVDRSQTLTKFIKEDEINLPPGELYELIDIAVTSACCPLYC